MKPRTDQPSAPHDPRAVRTSSPGVMARVRGRSTYTEIEAMEPHRHACEVRWVAALPSHRERHAFLAGVEKHRGKDAAQRLRVDVWQAMQPRRRAHGRVDETHLRV